MGKPKWPVYISDQRMELWIADAECADDDVDPEIFYPTTGANKTSMAQAFKICNECPVQAACLNYALKNNIREGIWGGKSEAEREKLRQVPA